MVGFEVIFINLAIWQYGRMHEKQDAFEIYQQKLSENPKAYNPHKTYSDWDIVKVEGVLDYENEKLLQNKRYKSYIGYRIITPLILNDGTRVLIDRGWIPKSYERAPKEKLSGKNKVSLQGVIRFNAKKDVWITGPLYGTTERIIKRVDIAAFPKMTEHKNMLIQVTSSDNPNIRSFIEKPHTGGKHSEYMLTWLALALLLPSLYLSLIFQRYRRE